MHLGNFALEIPQGHELDSGYVEMRHNTKYTLKLSNNDKRRCDAEVEVDGKLVGIWRVQSNNYIIIERPSHDDGCFTFYRLDSPESQKANLVENDKLGLVSVLFKPEKPYIAPTVHYSTSDSGMRYSTAGSGDIRYSTAPSPGGTGLSGRSEQQFRTVAPLDYDQDSFVQIHLRLVCVNDKLHEPRPLTPVSSPVPPPCSRTNHSGVLRKLRRFFFSNE